jgi:hypothetical protein
MKPEKNSQLQTKMQAVAVLFDQWRSTRKKRDPIPESLWEAAADLSPSYSTCQISKELRLDFNKLKHRILARSQRTASPEFVELKVERLFSMGQCLIEARSPAGFELKIQTAAALPPQCIELLSCFLDRGR